MSFNILADLVGLTFADVFGSLSIRPTWSDLVGATGTTAKSRVRTPNDRLGSMKSSVFKLSGDICIVAGVGGAFKDC